MADVIQFPGTQPAPQVELKPDASIALDAAKEADLAGVVIVGWDQTGMFRQFRTVSVDEANSLADLLKHDLMGEYMPEMDE